MSRPTLCAPCEGGVHARHVRDWNIRPGLLGGDYCPCPGGEECAQRGRRALADRFAEMVSSADLTAPTVPAVMPRDYPARSCIDCGYSTYHAPEDCHMRAAEIEHARRESLGARQRLADLTGDPS